MARQRVTTTTTTRRRYSGSSGGATVTKSSPSGKTSIGTGSGGTSKKKGPARCSECGKFKR